VTARAVEEALAEGVVGVDHADAQSRPREQLRFRGAIGRHRGVIVEMIARQIREQGDVERDTVDPALVDAVRGHLHHCGLRARRAVIGEHLLQQRGIGRRVRRRLERTDQSVAQRAQHRSAPSGGIEPGRNPVRARRLAVGAGDADHPQVARWMPVHSIRDEPELGLQLVDRQVRQLPRDSSEALRLPEDRARRGDRVGCTRGRRDARRDTRRMRRPGRAGGCRS
jgi:hypothetical protein